MAIIASKPVVGRPGASKSGAVCMMGTTFEPGKLLVRKACTLEGT